MYICWQKNADRFFSNDNNNIIIQSNGDIHAISATSPFTATATNIHIVGTAAEAAAWVKDGTISGIVVL